MATHGGRRPGAGRKPIDGEKRVKTAIWFPAALLRALRVRVAHGKRSAFIAAAVKERLEREKENENDNRASG